MHITCAQKNKCLKEQIDKKTDTIKYRAYCIDHKPRDASRRISSQFVRGRVLKAKNEQKNQKEHSNQINSNWITNAAVANCVRPPSVRPPPVVSPVKESKKEKRSRKYENKKKKNDSEKFLRSISADTESDAISLFADNDLDEILNKKTPLFAGTESDEIPSKKSSVLGAADDLKMWWDTRDLRAENHSLLGDSNKENIDAMRFKDGKIAKVGIILCSNFSYVNSSPKAKTIQKLYVFIGNI